MRAKRAAGRLKCGYLDAMQSGVPSTDEAGETSPRRARMQQQRVQCLSSDADYTSSSEQSCDTVIYVGKNGRVLSDRELTDNEGPPAPPPPSKPAAAVTPSPSVQKQQSTPPARCSSEVCGDGCSSGGKVSPPSAVTPPAPSSVVDHSAAHGCVGQSHRAELLVSYQRMRSSLAAADSRHGDVTATAGGGEGAAVRSSTDCPNTSAAEKLRKTPAASRRGADGSAAAVVERWIDGPRSADVEAASVAAVVGGTSADDAAAAAAAGELWVDGPAEFQRDPNSLVESLRSPMKLRKFKCAKLYRARAAAVAAAAAENVEGVDTTTSKRAPAADGAETTRKDIDGVAASSAAGRHKAKDQSCLLTDAAVDSVAAACHAVMTEELGRWRAHRRSSGRKSTTTTTTNHVTLASFYSPDRCPPGSAQSSPGHRLHPAGGAVKGGGGVPCGDRTAQWVRSVQVATAAAGVAPSSSSSSRFSRPMSPLKSQSVDRVLRGCAVDLRTWHDDSASDDAVTAVSNNSPPPDYATCVAADLERRRRRTTASPVNNLDINENLSGLPPPLKLLPVSSFTPLHLAAAPYLYGVAPPPFTGVVEPSANGRRPTSGCQQQPEAVFDSSTWPRRQDGGSVVSLPAVDVGSEVTSTPCKRLHHPDGASNPQLSEEVSRSDDVIVDPVDCCKLLTLLNGDGDPLSTAMPPPPSSSTRRQCSCHADAVDLLRCRSSLIDSCDTPFALSPICMRLAAHEDAILGSNVPPRSDSDQHRSTTTRQHSGGIVPPAAASNLSKAVPSTRLKALPSTPSKTASPKRNKSSSGVSLLRCIHPRGGSKSRSSKTGHRQAEAAFPDGDGVGYQRQATDAQRLAGDSGVADRSTDSDRGSSLSECTPPTALELARRLCSGDDDDDDDASSDYWSARASADHIPSTPRLISTTTASTHHTDGRFRFALHNFVSSPLILPNWLLLSHRLHLHLGSFSLRCQRKSRHIM